MRKLNLSIDAGPKPTDPLQIFGKLTLRGSIQNIWEPQADALRKWSKKRERPDIAIEMNTGGGKTLVGLLIAQSLVNETNGRVLYLCANNQLVEQTCAHAREVGLSPALRYDRSWEGKGEFDAGQAFCLTNYASVFNGKSIFRNEEIDALVFDDAHVAENSIREQFTLRIPAYHEAFPQILDLCRSHFANSGREFHFQDIAANRSRSVLFIPAFVVSQHVGKFRSILLESEIEESKNQFAWEHLKDHLRHCCFVASGSELQITPAVPPLAQLNYFGQDTKRVYLTATLPSQASFARTFGIADAEVIRPSGKSGDAQRLFVLVPGEDDDEQREHAKHFVSNRKSCVISASKRRGQKWEPPAEIFGTVNGQMQIDRFARSRDARMLGLIARYDGIDLPGDSCRLLILDGLPSGESLIDRFVDENIQVETIRTSHTATRVVQAIGRIFRSNTDHGVVLLVGPKLQAWLRSHRNRTYLPELLQKQLLLGFELAKHIDLQETSWEELIEAILSGDANWDQTYSDYIDEFESHSLSASSDWHVQLIIEERLAVDRLWSGQFQQAVDSFKRLADRALDHDKRLAAWYRHWRGLSLLCAGDRPSAYSQFIEAANVRSELGRPLGEGTRGPSADVEIGFQARALTDQYRRGKSKVLRKCEEVGSALVYGSSAKKAEEALKELGLLLGLQALRPDKSLQTGPDVIWQGEGSASVWGFELKTNKSMEGEYAKRTLHNVTTIGSGWWRIMGRIVY